MTDSKRRVALTLILLLTGASPLFAADPPGLRSALIHHQQPRLAVIIVVDQLRYDYLTNFADLFLPPLVAGGKPGGFRYLMERGAFFTDCRYEHVPTFTAVGHSVISTGAYPYKSGIIANDWHDPATGKSKYSVEDAKSPLVGGNPDPKLGRSPANLRVTTIGDELRLSNNGHSHAVSLSLKDRAAILLAGHMPSACIWFDRDIGRWVSSAWFARSGKLPAWVDQLNAEPFLAGVRGRKWDKLLPPQAYARVRPDNAAYAAEFKGVGKGWPKVIDGGPSGKPRDFYEAVVDSPFGNELTFLAANHAVTGEKLGQRDACDLLTINLASNDYVGHQFGPYSPEVLDITVRTDRMLSAFFTTLDGQVPGGLSNVVIVLTADHGVAPIPEQLALNQVPAGRIVEDDISKVVNDAFEPRWGKDKYVLAFDEPHLYLDPAVLARKGILRPEADDVASAALLTLPGISGAYTRSQILSGRMPATDEAMHVVHGYHPFEAGDVVLTFSPQWIVSFEKTEGTSHGTHYTYDTHVPLLMAGPDIRPGLYSRRSSPIDISVTLATMLGIATPSGAEGRVLEEALVK